MEFHAFAAGIGATLLYWSTVEWIEYFNILKNDQMEDANIMDVLQILSTFSLGFYCMGNLLFACSSIWSSFKSKA